MKIENKNIIELIKFTVLFIFIIWFLLLIHMNIGYIDIEPLDLFPPFES